MKVYFDNAATTKILPEAAEFMVNVMLEKYGNPSSTSVMGIEAEEVLKDSANKIASLINASEEEIYFTSGGTESDNWAVFGTAEGYVRSGRHMLYTSVEHPAINAPFEVIKEKGFETEKIPVDSKGYIDIDSLKRLIRKDTIFVGVILVNNETGTIQDIEAIGRAIKEVNPNAVFHVDAVQAFGKYRIDVNKCHIDTMAASAHKFNGPRGCGIFYMRKGLKVKPIIYGGGQQKNQRPGTENVPGAAATALAACESYRNIEPDSEKVREIKRLLCERILNEIPDTFINGDSVEKASPYVLNVGFMGLRSEVLLHALEADGIFVSAGSACNSKKNVQSAVLSAMGKTADEIEGSIRFSFSRFNTIEEAEYCFEKLKSAVSVLRRFNRKR